MHAIAGKAAALGEALKPEFKEYQRRILRTRRLSADLPDRTGLEAGFRRN